MHERPTFGSLFAGIGGIDLGLERAGWECRFQVEWDPYCQHVLAHHWPDVPRYGDITTVDWSSVERVDLLAGGFPCQPFSLAGQRRGKSDDRWLWPAFAAAIRALRPRLVLVENVPGLLAGHGGMGTVLGDLAELGYDAEWDSIPAAAVGAPHLRYRVWIVAYAHDLSGQRLSGLLDSLWASFGDDPDGRRGAVPDPDSGELWDEPVTVGGSRSTSVPGHDGANGHVADPDSARFPDVQRSGAIPECSRLGSPVGRGSSFAMGDTNGTPPDSHAPDGGPRRAASQPGRWSVEPDVGRVAHGVPARVDRLRALGNAVVPQVVEVIGRQLLKALP